MVGGDPTMVSNFTDVKKTIQRIKEIFTNHSRQEIYHMLRECSMDPNDTVQKLLVQDPFQEVKNKRDRKKEVLELTKIVFLQKIREFLLSMERKLDILSPPSRVIKSDLGISQLSHVVESNHGSFEESSFRISHGPRISCTAGSILLPIGSNDSASKMASNEDGRGKITIPEERKKPTDSHRLSRSKSSYSQSSHVDSSRKGPPIMKWMPKSTTQPAGQQSGPPRVAAEDNHGLKLGDFVLSDHNQVAAKDGNLPEQKDSNFDMQENRNHFRVVEFKPDSKRSNQAAVDQRQGSQLSGLLSAPVYSPFRPIQNPIGSSGIQNPIAIQRPFAPWTSYYNNFPPRFYNYNGNPIYESQQAFGQALTQQPVPRYQQTTAPPILNYASNYSGYPYYPQFYVSPGDPHFASNSSFLPQPLAAAPPMPQNGNADVTGHQYGGASFYVSGMQVMGGSYYSYHQGQPMGYGVVNPNHSAAAAAGQQQAALPPISHPNGFPHLHQAAQMK